MERVIEASNLLEDASRHADITHAMRSYSPTLPRLTCLHRHVGFARLEINKYPGAQLADFLIFPVSSATLADCT